MSRAPCRAISQSFAGVAQSARAGVSYAPGRGFDSLLRHRFPRCFLQWGPLHGDPAAQHSSKHLRGVAQRQLVVSSQAWLSAHFGLRTSVTQAKHTESAMQAATNVPHAAPVQGMHSSGGRAGTPGVTTGGTKKHNAGHTSRQVGATHAQLRSGRRLLDRRHASSSGLVRQAVQSGSPLHVAHSGSHCAARQLKHSSVDASGSVTSLLLSAEPPSERGGGG